jgi:hypothetical protein
MQPLITRVRKPVEREGAEFYLFLLLLSFAASVSLTRLFLELTGYPQLGLAHADLCQPLGVSGGRYSSRRGRRVVHG